MKFWILTWQFWVKNLIILNFWIFQLFYDMLNSTFQNFNLFWSISTEFWNLITQNFENFKIVLKFWNFKIFKILNPKFWNFEILKFWNFEFQNLWNIFLKLWNFEILKFVYMFWNFEMLTFQFLYILLRFPHVFVKRSVNVVSSAVFRV